MAELLAGAYEVHVRMEIPNVDTWAWSTTKRVCLSDAATGSGMPIPVLSPNNPFGKCQATSISLNGVNLTYEISCDGRGAARAYAAYTLVPGGFKGRIVMVLGAKNMSMRELQVGRRLGDCDLVASQH